MNTRSARPTGDTIVPRLLDAVDSLCTVMSPSDVTMRMIATESGLSLGVAYRYFESREELLGAAMDRMAGRITEAATANQPIATVTSVWRALESYPAFPRLVTSLILEGRDVSEVMSQHPLMRDIGRSAAARGMDDPTTVAGVTGFVVLAGVLYGPMLNSIVGRDPDDPRMHKAAAEMMALWMDERADDDSER